MLGSATQECESLEARLAELTSDVNKRKSSALQELQQDEKVLALRARWVRKQHRCPFTC